MNIRVTVSAALCDRTKEAQIHLSVNGLTPVVLTLTQARELTQLLTQTIEAAVSDAWVFEFLTRVIGLSEPSAEQALANFRHVREQRNLLPH